MPDVQGVLLSDPVRGLAGHSINGLVTQQLLTVLAVSSQGYGAWTPSRPPEASGLLVVPRFTLKPASLSLPRVCCAA